MTITEQATKAITAAEGTQAARAALHSLLTGPAWCEAGAPNPAWASDAEAWHGLSVGHASVQHAVLERRLGEVLRSLRRLAPAARSGVAGATLAAEAIRLGSEALGWERLAAGTLLLRRRGQDGDAQQARRALEDALRSLHGLLARPELPARHRAIVSLACALPGLPELLEPNSSPTPPTVLSQAQSEALVDMLRSRDPAYNAAVLARLEAEAGIARVTRALVGRSCSVLSEERGADDADVTSGIRFDAARNAYVATTVAKIQSWQFHLRLRQFLDWKLPEFFVAREELEARLLAATVDPDSGEPLVAPERIAALLDALVDAGPSQDEQVAPLLDAPLELQFSSSDGGDVPHSVAWQLTPRLLGTLLANLDQPQQHAELHAAASRERDALAAILQERLQKIGPVLERYPGIPRHHKRGHWAFVNLGNTGQSVAEMVREGGVLPHGETLLTTEMLRARYAEASRLKVRFVLNDRLEIVVLDDQDYWRILSDYGFPPNHELLCGTRPILASGYLTFDRGRIVGIEDDGVMIPGKLSEQLPPILEVLQALGFDLDMKEVARTTLALDWGAFRKCLKRDPAELPELEHPLPSPASFRDRLVGSPIPARAPLAFAYVRRALADLEGSQPGLDRPSRVAAIEPIALAALHGFYLINVGAWALARGELPKGVEFVDEAVVPFMIQKVLGG